jgi:hypothetical protein
VAGVVTRLREIRDALPAGDGPAVFNGVYLTVTERIAADLHAAARFTDPAFVADLDVRFARLWLAAYDAAVAGRKVPSAWAPLFEERSTRGLLPIQFALAGMNAHIENDLPLAVVATCRARGLAPDDAVRADYEHVNDVLAGVEAEIRRSFLTEVERRLDQGIGPAVHLVSSWSIDKARDLAWVTVETLWATSRFERLQRECVRALGHTVGLGSRCLLTPVVPAPEPDMAPTH